MAHRSRLSITDEELLEELRKLGYDDVPKEIYKVVKEDLEKLVELDENELSPDFDVSPISPISPLSSVSRTGSNSLRQNSNRNRSKIPVQQTESHFAGFRNRASNNNNPSPMSSDDYAFATDDNRNLETTSSSSTASKTIKRKVLRHKNGKAVITEHLLSVSNISNSSSISSRDSPQSFESTSSEELSFQSNGSTGSVTNVGTALFSTARSTSSLASVRSAPPCLRNSRRKKNDPVAMYNYYKKFWDNFKPPGEKKHDRLRWAVRDKMLDYNL